LCPYLLRALARTVLLPFVVELSLVHAGPTLGTRTVWCVRNRKGKRGLQGEEVERGLAWRTCTRLLWELVRTVFFLRPCAFALPPIAWYIYNIYSFRLDTSRSRSFHFCIFVDGFLAGDPTMLYDESETIINMRMYSFRTRQGQESRKAELQGYLGPVNPASVDNPRTGR
jgi:hypothetical protein